MEGHTMLSHGQQKRKKNVQKSATELQLFHIIFCSHHDTQNSCSLRHSTSIHNVSLHSVLQKDHQSTSFKCVLMFAGLVKSIGVSNYTVDHLEELLQYSTVTPAVLQVLSPSHLFCFPYISKCGDKEKMFNKSRASQLKIVSLYSQNQMQATLRVRG